MSVSVVILSYNRPNFLQKALISCKDAAEIIVMDDGSDFDVVNTVREIVPNAIVVNGRKRAPIEHVTNLNWAQFLSAGCTLATQPYICYLCDDDQIAPGWLNAIPQLLKLHECIVGKTIMEDGTLEPQHLVLGNFCLGNFAHRKHLSGYWDASWEIPGPENFFHAVLTSCGVYPFRVEIPALLSSEHKHKLSKCVTTGWPGKLNANALALYEGGIWEE